MWASKYQNGNCIIYLKFNPIKWCLPKFCEVSFFSILLYSFHHINISGREGKNVIKAGKESDIWIADLGKVGPGYIVSNRRIKKIWVLFYAPRDVTVGGGQICPPLEFMYKIDQISFLGLVFCRIPSSDPLSWIFMHK